LCGVEIGVEQRHLRDGERRRQEYEKDDELEAAGKLGA